MVRVMVSGMVRVMVMSRVRLRLRVGVNHVPTLAFVVCTGAEGLAFRVRVRVRVSHVPLKSIEIA